MSTSSSRLTLALLLALGCVSTSLAQESPLPLPLLLPPAAPVMVAPPAPDSGLVIPAVRIIPEAASTSAEPPIIPVVNHYRPIPIVPDPLSQPPQVVEEPVHGPVYLPVGRAGDHDDPYRMQRNRPGVIRPIPEKMPKVQNLFNRHGLCCWSHPHRIGCGNLHSYSHFIFGSCRTFFGEACNQGAEK